MKLLRLKIGEPFRCLQAGFELHFQREWDQENADNFAPYILAGPNGSGKSNVLEALAAIFYQLECQYLTYRPDVLVPPDENDNEDEKNTPDQQPAVRGDRHLAAVQGRSRHRGA